MSLFSRLFSSKAQKRKGVVPIRARYDAAQDSNETANIWSAADSLDADSSNSLAVRSKLRQRSRYERANNGHASGIIRTHANYVVGTGPKLRLQTTSPGFNAMVEDAWRRWSTETGFVRKLRTMCRARVGDGEAFGILAINRNLRDRVKIDMRLIECDQVTAPVGKTETQGYIDGITFDEFGNPASYDVLRRHPGASWYSGLGIESDTIDARYVVHWFGGDERPGQHRGVPELAPTLNLYATGRRYREAVVAAAETAADFAVLVKSDLEPEDGDDAVTPLTSLPIDKRTMTFLPDKQEPYQMKAEQPTTTYDTFTRAMLCEEARPLNMPYNIAACDSSGYSYSGGQLDHLTYFVAIDVERQDCEQAVLEKVFALWYAEAAREYEWIGDADAAPKHAWDWCAKPQTDPEKTANSRKVRLSCGDASPSELAAEDGVDFEDRVTALAADYGVSVEAIKARMFQANFQQSGGAPNQEAKPTGIPKSNGTNRVAAMFSESMQ